MGQIERSLLAPRKPGVVGVVGGRGGTAAVRVQSFDMWVKTHSL